MSNELDRKTTMELFNDHMSIAVDRAKQLSKKYKGWKPLVKQLEGAHYNGKQLYDIHVLTKTQEEDIIKQVMQ